MTKQNNGKYYIIYYIALNSKMIKINNILINISIT